MMGLFEHSLNAEKDPAAAKWDSLYTRTVGRAGEGSGWVVVLLSLAAGHPGSDKVLPYLVTGGAGGTRAC